MQHSFPVKFMLVMNMMNIRGLIKRKQCLEPRPCSKLFNKYNVIHKLQVELLSADC